MSAHTSHRRRRTEHCSALIFLMSATYAGHGLTPDWIQLLAFASPAMDSLAASLDGWRVHPGDALLALLYLCYGVATARAERAARAERPAPAPQIEFQAEPA